MQDRAHTQTQHSTPLVQDEAAALRRFLDSALRDSLPTIALVFGVLYTIFTVSHLLVLTGSVARTIVMVAATTAIINFTLTWALRRWTLPSRWAHSVAAADTLLVLFNIMLHLVLTDDPLIKESDYHFQIVTGMKSGIARMETIVGSILDMAKIDSRVMQLHPELLLLTHLVQSVRTTFSEACERRNLTITLEGLDALPMIEADTEAIRKVIYHLLTNAVKYTPNEGAITISGRLLPANDVEYPDGSVEIIVSDTGIGIDPSAKELIFAKFYQIGEVAVHSSGTTKFKGGGPGLGLAIARGIVEAHGGKIWAESPGYNEEICPGSHFHVVLPLRSRSLGTPISRSVYQS
jgi:signal transduction histidine kinase